jgi:hypothetical protein
MSLYEIAASQELPSQGNQGLMNVGWRPVASLPLLPPHVLPAEYAQAMVELDPLCMEEVEVPNCPRRSHEDAPHGHPLDDIRYVLGQQHVGVIADLLQRP